MAHPASLDRGERPIHDRHIDDRQWPVRDSPVDWEDRPDRDRGLADARGRADPQGRRHDGAVRPAVRPVARPVRLTMATVLVLASTVVGIAALLPWSRLSSRGETRVFTGLAVGDGRVTFLLAVALVTIGLARLAGRPLSDADVTVARLFTVALVAVTVSDLVLGPPTLATFRGISANEIEVRPEVGVLVSAGAAAVALLAALLLRSRKDRSAVRRT
jgi:hypothetical protein